MRRKKWWVVGIYYYSFSVQLFYYACAILIVLAVPVIRSTQFIPLRIDTMFIGSVLIIIAFCLSLWRFIVGAKKEYVEKNLG